MTAIITSFVTEENAAITVDWVVMTAACVAVCLAAAAVVSGGMENITNDTANDLAGITPVNSVMAFENNVDISD